MWVTKEVNFCVGSNGGRIFLGRGFDYSWVKWLSHESSR